MSRANRTFLQDAYVRIQTIRQFERRAVELTTGDDPAIVGSIHLCAGQEAIPVGAAAALRDDDRMIATYRGHGWALESGLSPFELMAELCHRRDGINGGRAGSPLLMAPDRRFIGENSIVGAGGTIACGVAIAAKLQKSGRVVAVSFGDGAISQGSLHEAFTMAGAQKLPVIFVCENNEWAEMTPTSHVFGGDIADRAECYGMAGEVVDGGDPVAVRDAVARAAKRARSGAGATLLECKTVRLWGHYNRDIEHYRPSSNRRSAVERDPVTLLRQRLLADGSSASEIDDLDMEANSAIDSAVERALASPMPDPASLRDHLFAQDRVPEPLLGKIETLTYAQAVNRALLDEMTARPEVIVLGEDVGKPGGVFGLTRGLQKQFGAERVIDTPIAESAILGSAVGAAIDGLRPVAEIMFADFLFVALDQIVNQAANIRYVSNGRASAPLVVRTQQGVTPGSCAQHAQCVEAILAHVPGLKVGLPITPQDAYSMLRAAIADPDPCIIIEARSAFARSADVEIGGGIEAAAGAKLLTEGADLAIVSWGTAIYPALEAVEMLRADQIHASLLNLRWLSPIDDAAIANVVRKCGRVLIVHEASLTGGFGAEIAARINEQHFDHLIAPVRRMGAEDIRMPASPLLQRHAIPNATTIAAAARVLIGEKFQASTVAELA